MRRAGRRRKVQRRRVAVDAAQRPVKQAEQVGHLVALVEIAGDERRGGQIFHRHDLNVGISVLHLRKVPEDKFLFGRGRIKSLLNKNVLVQLTR